MNDHFETNASYWSNATETLEEWRRSEAMRPDPRAKRMANHAAKMEHERNRYKQWAIKFRELLAPLAWLDGVDNPNATELEILKFDEENNL